MKTLERFSRFFVRFRYPVTLPEDIALALGIDVSNYDTFDELIQKLIHLQSYPKNLIKYMPRVKAELAFNHAQRKENFLQSSLFSFYFSQGWMEFKLEFDENALLRRIYVHHNRISLEKSIEIPLQSV